MKYLKSGYFEKMGEIIMKEEQIYLSALFWERECANYKKSKGTI
jgi:hypothetical protein